MSSLIKDSTITLVTRGSLFLISVGSSIIIARSLGPSFKGAYSILILIITISSLLVLFGLGSANVFYGSRNPQQLPVLAGNSLVASLGLGFLGVIVVELICLFPFFQDYLVENNIPISWLRWLILLLPIIQLNAYLKEIIRASGDMVRYNLVALWRALTNFSGVVVFVWILNLGLEGAIGSWVLAAVSTSLLIIWWVLDITKKQLAVEWSTLKRSFSFGIRLYPGNIAQFLNYRLDVFLVGFFLTPSDVGFYTIATSLAEKLWELPLAINTVLLHRVAKAEDRDQANISTARVSRVVALSVGVMCLLVMALGYPLILILYGRAYLPAVPALLALMPGIWFLGVGKLMATHLSASGRPEVGTIGAVISLTVTLALNILLIPKVGIVGAAIASSASYILATSFFIMTFLRVTSLRLKDVVIIRREDLELLYRAMRDMFLSHYSKRQLSKR